MFQDEGTEADATASCATARCDVHVCSQAKYLDMLSTILTQTPEILDAVFQTDRSNKILESLAEKVHKYGVIPDAHSLCSVRIRPVISLHRLKACLM